MHLSHLFHIQPLLAHYGYTGIFVMIFLESSLFFILPGDSFLFTAGLLAPVLGFKVWILVLLVTIATFLGGYVGYAIGWYVLKLEKYAFFRKFLKPEHIEAAHVFFSKHGRVSVLLARFVPIIRNFVPIVAGIARMDRKEFLKYSVLGSILWSAGFVLTGYYLGRIFPGIKHYLPYLGILVVLVSILPAIYGWWKQRHSKA